MGDLPATDLPGFLPENKIRRTKKKYDEGSGGGEGKVARCQDDENESGMCDAVRR